MNALSSLEIETCIPAAVALPFGGTAYSASIVASSAQESAAANRKWVCAFNSKGKTMFLQGSISVGNAPHSVSLLSAASPDEKWEQELMQCQRFGQIPVDQSENIAFDAYVCPSAVVTSLGIDREHSGRR